MNKFTDDTPIAMLTVGQLKEILDIGRILGNLIANQAPTEQVMTIEEVVRLTGYSKATIYKFTSDRKIPFRKPEHGGRRLYFQPIKKALIIKNKKQTSKPAFDPEVPPREGLIFYRSFYEALASMKPMARLHLYDVIMRYAFYGEEPTDLKGEQERIFIIIRPQLNANERKRQAKYKEKATKKNNNKKLNEFFTKTEDEENGNLQIFSDIQYE